MPSRKYIAGSGYRYGFNGKENDKDAGEGIQDYGMRIYDGRLGRFLSVDPLTKEYPWNSTYAFAENDVMRSIDIEGAEKYIVTGIMWKGSGGTQLHNLTTQTLEKPGPFGNGTYYHISYDNYTYSSKGRSGGQHEVVGYIPAAEEKPSLWNKFWASVLNGGAHDGGGANGSRSNQAFGIIFQSGEGGPGTTQTGTGNNADNFEVSEGTGVFSFVGGVGGKLSVLQLSEEAKRNIRVITKKMDALASLNESQGSTVLSIEELVNKMLIDPSSENSNSPANRKKIVEEAVKEVTKPAPIKETIIKGPAGVKRDPNSKKITQYSTSDIKTIKSNNSKTPDTIRTTKYKKPKT